MIISDFLNCCIKLSRGLRVQKDTSFHMVYFRVCRILEGFGANHH